MRTVSYISLRQLPPRLVRVLLVYLMIVKSYIFSTHHINPLYNPITIAFNDNFVFNPKTPGQRGLASQGVGLWRVYEHDAVGQNFRMPEMFGVPVVPAALDWVKAWCLVYHWYLR